MLRSFRRPLCSSRVLAAGSDRGGQRAPLLYSLIVTAKINDVISIARVAKLLDEDEAWLERLAKEMGPEDGGLSPRPPPYSNAASIGRRKPSANRLV
jgi:hypothetical protein